MPTDWEDHAGLKQLDQIANDKLGFKLHDWQRLGAARLLSGKNVLLLTATGSRKSCLFYMYALAQPNHLVVVILPLKLLENNMINRIRMVH